MKSRNAKAASAGTAAGDDKTQHPPNQQQQQQHHQQRRSSLRVMMPKLPSNDSLSGVSVGVPSSPGDLHNCLCVFFMFCSNVSVNGVLEK